MVTKSVKNWNCPLRPLFVLSSTVGRGWTGLAWEAPVGLSCVSRPATASEPQPAFERYSSTIRF